MTDAHVGMVTLVSGDPDDDLVDHDTDGDCICGPTTEPVVRGDGSIVWLVVHHRLDGRELREPSDSKPQH